MFIASHELDSREPNQLRIVGEAFVVFEIPIRRIFEPGGVTVEKRELCAVTVQIGMDVVPLRDSGDASVVKQPDRN